MSVIDKLDELIDDSSFGWRKFFKDNRELVVQIQKVLDRKGEFYPDVDDVFKIFELVPPEKIKVIILGQDPYINGEAMGMSFSIKPGSKIAPSLKNIFKVIKINTGRSSICVRDGDLTPWAEQGVFLLNACLTVSPKNNEVEGKTGSGSHGDIWEGFIVRVIQYIFKCEHTGFSKDPDVSDSEEESDSEESGSAAGSNAGTPAVDYAEKPIAMLWGKEAQKYRKHFTGLILETSHPSPFSFARGFSEMKHFSIINQQLRQKIQW